MAHRTRTWTAGLLLLAGALAGCSSDSQALDPSVRNLQAGAPGAPSEVLTEVPDEIGLASPFSDDDVAFLADMRVHHGQALAMTALVPDRAGREDLALFAHRMEIGQQSEVELIDRLLAENDEVVARLGGSGHADHDGHTADGDHSDMPGMLTDAEMAALGAAEGEEFVRLFLQSMTRHHEGALSMVADLLAEQGAPVESRVYAFAAEVESDQSIEMSRMARMWADLGSA